MLQAIVPKTVPTLEQIEFETVRDLETVIPAEIMKSIWLQNSLYQYSH